MSPNAQGYVNGSITELLLKHHLEAKNFEVKRIKEKWEGKKHANHHGDFYFRNKGSDLWYVLESKGVKSNTEDWNKLYNLPKLKKLLFDYNEIIHWLDHGIEVEPQINEWIRVNLPDIIDEPILFTYEEIHDYLNSPPRRETPKMIAMQALAHYTREQIDNMIKERLSYVMSNYRASATIFT